MKRTNRFVVLMLLVVAGCVSVSTVRVGDESKVYPEVAPEGVRIFTSPDRVPGEYEEIAILRASGSDTYTSEEGMALAMKKKAGAMGANGIIMGGFKDPGGGEKIAAALFGTSTSRKGEALAIRWTPKQK